MPQRPTDVLDDADMTAAGRRGLRAGVTEISARATTKYMRTGGTNVGPNTQTGPGSLRRQRGRLARSLTGARSAQPSPSAIRAAPEGVFDLSPTSNGVKLTYGSEVPYAAAHEYGLSETVQVGSHQRTMTQGFGPDSAYPQTVSVRAHSRQMDLPERPYLRSALDDSLEEVAEAIAREAKEELFGED